MEALRKAPDPRFDENAILEFLDFFEFLVPKKFKKMTKMVLGGRWVGLGGGWVGLGGRGGVGEGGGVGPGGPGGPLGGPGGPWALALALGPGPGPVAYTSNSR